MQWQIVTRDPEGTSKFLHEVFDWQVQADNAMGYRVVDTCSEEGIDGGIWPSPPGGPTFVQLFVDVEDVAAAVARAVERGARVIIPPQKLPDGDEMAVLHGPEGLPLGIMRRAR
jgi:hypothetical protein